MKSRTGKIARLPRAIRETLNHRLADGEEGKALVGWLNGLPEVLEVLARDFGGRLILEQNLSEWRAGGYRDWCSRQETIEMMRQMEEDADDLCGGEGLLSDRLSKLLSALYASLVAATASVKDWRKPRNRALLKELCEEVSILRRLDHSTARLKLEEELLETRKAELRLAGEEQRKRTHAEWREWTDGYMQHLLDTSETPEEALRGVMILMHGHADENLINEQSTKLREKAGLSEVPADATLLERTEDLLKTHDLAREKRRAAAQGDQTKSIPIKP